MSRSNLESGEISPARRDLIRFRRMLVARYRVRQMSTSEIAEQLKFDYPEFVNPDTGDYWSFQTIAKDLHALQKMWLDDLQLDIDAHKARVFAELQEVKRECWECHDLTNLLTALHHEIRLLGLNEAQTINLLHGVHESLEDKLQVLSRRLHQESQDFQQTTDPPALELHSFKVLPEGLTPDPSSHAGSQRIQKALEPQRERVALFKKTGKVRVPYLEPDRDK